MVHRFAFRSRTNKRSDLINPDFSGLLKEPFNRSMFFVGAIATCKDVAALFSDLATEITSAVHLLG